MTSLNTYLDAIKPFAKSLQEKAAKLTDVVDEQLKKTQENLERKRTKVIEASESDGLPRAWRSSTQNPLGEFIDPPPAPIPSPIEAERPRTFILDHEPKTVSRKKTIRQKKLLEIEIDNERKQDVHQCLVDIITQIIKNEEIENNSNQLPEIVIPTDTVVEEIPTDNIIEENPIDEIPPTNEDNSDSHETQSTTTENELTESINPLDNSLEKSYACIDNFSILIFEEPANIPPIDDDSNKQTTITPSVLEPLSAIVTTPSPLIPKEKRFSALNSYSLPSDIIIAHMSCSLTQIYLCTNKQILFYARVPENNAYHSLSWYRYNLPADQLLVSPSNETIWRIYDRQIYLSSDAVKLTPLGIRWTELKFHQGEKLLSISITDHYAWYIKQDETLWLIRINEENQEAINVLCPFTLKHVVCSVDKVGVSTNDGQILIRSGCTNDCPEGGGWIFIQHNFGPFDDFTLMKNLDMICIIDKKHRVWIHDWSPDGKFYEVLRNDEYTFKTMKNQYLIDINERFLCFTDSQEQLYIFSNSLTGIHWSLVQKGTRLQRLIDAFPNEDHVWALTTDGVITSSSGQILEKPRQAQHLTHASFVPYGDFQRILWSLDESCNIYTRNILDNNSQWEQLDQSQFDWNRRLVDIDCNTIGVWAIDDRGCVHFRHGHRSNSDEFSYLNAAWIPIPGDAKNHRLFAQIFCGPAEWMVYATDNKQAVYVRIGIDENNHIGTSWKMIEDCSALELVLSEHTLWLLTSHGRIECRENISLVNPIGTRTTRLPGRFNSITVSTDDEQMWALYPPHHLFKLDRLPILFEK